MLVKVCGLNSVDNIANLPLELIDWLGFIFYEKSPRNVSIEPDQAFFKLTSNHKRVGVFVNTPLTSVFAKVQRYKLDIVQLHGQEPVAHCAYLKHNGVSVIKVISVNEDTDFHLYEEYEPVVDYFLLDTKSVLRGGTGEKFNWEILGKYTLNTPFILSGGIGPDDAQLIYQINLEKCAGIDINSRFEIEPGIKDPAQIKTFLESLKDTKYVEN